MNKKYFKKSCLVSGKFFLLCPNNILFDIQFELIFIYLGCSNNDLLTPNESFFQFPTDCVIKKKWMYLTGAKQS